ncbi:MAG: hypothetical protein JXQ90_18015 [Cyclobacteriaceae bacterium]
MRLDWIFQDYGQNIVELWREQQFFIRTEQVKALENEKLFTARPDLVPVKGEIEGTVQLEPTNPEIRESWELHGLLLEPIYNEKFNKN